MSENEFDKDKNGFSIASLVLGIAGILLFFMPFIGTIAAILAIIFGGVALHNKTGSEGMSIAGIILGILAILGWIIIVLVIGLGFAAFTAVPTTVVPVELTATP